MQKEFGLEHGGAIRAFGNPGHWAEVDVVRKSKVVVQQRKLKQLIEEATVDCYDEWEQASGFLAMIQDHLACPVMARVVGEPVQVVGFDNAEGGTDIVALCRRQGKTYKIGILSLEWDGMLPKMDMRYGNRGNPRKNGWGWWTMGYTIG